MRFDVRETMTAWGARTRAGMAGAMARLEADDRVRVRQAMLAAGSAAAAILIVLMTGLVAAGPLLLADIVVAVAAWFGGMSSGFAAAAAATLTLWFGARPLGGVHLAASMAAVLFAKGLLEAWGSDVLSRHWKAGERAHADLKAERDRLYNELRAVEHDLVLTRTASAKASAELMREAEAARIQLNTLQEITDPALDVMHGSEIVALLLERLRAAVQADGVALCSIEGRAGRIHSASTGIAPLGAVKRSLAEVHDMRGRRTNLIHNDADRVVEASLCGWPKDVTSLIAVPVVRGGHLRVVLEVANRRGIRATEWELALIQVVAERAAGLLRQDAYLESSAVA